MTDRQSLAGAPFGFVGIIIEAYLEIIFCFHSSQYLWLIPPNFLVSKKDRRNLERMLCERASGGFAFKRCCVYGMWVCSLIDTQMCCKELKITSVERLRTTFYRSEF